MHLKMLIDGVVRQTTVLIAQLSTHGGVRSPLSHVADQVFLELSREIEAQGVRRRVAADMFGMALRSYQKKMQRLSEGASVRDTTLWEALLAFIEANQPDRRRVRERFSQDGEGEVTAVLGDLKRSGLVHQTGQGDFAVYGVTTEAVRHRIQRESDLESVANVAWLYVFRGAAATFEELSELIPADRTLVEEAVAQLLADGRLYEDNGEVRARNVVLPLGGEQGWEAAVLDHFRAVAVAISRKIGAGQRGSRPDDRIGGATFTFTVAPGHPFERDVYDLLRQSRLKVQTLWDRVSAHNDRHPPDEDRAVRVTYYLGQTLDEQMEEPPPRRKEEKV